MTEAFSMKAKMAGIMSIPDSNCVELIGVDDMADPRNYESVLEELAKSNMDSKILFKEFIQNINEEEFDELFDAYTKFKFPVVFEDMYYNFCKDEAASMIDSKGLEYYWENRYKEEL